jgi:hypothetical protein
MMSRTELDRHANISSENLARIENCMTFRMEKNEKVFFIGM